MNNLFKNKYKRNVQEQEQKNKKKKKNFFSHKL